ncbi:hypothetical protein [Enterocloster clostridioformis]|nr:hypothetical protein [Enterocloster clostridioformis]
MLSGMDINPQQFLQRSPDVHGMFPGKGKELGHIGAGPAGDQYAQLQLS